MPDESRGKLLLVGPYVPRRCGIAAYVVQLEAALKAAGYQVDVLSPPDCAGTIREELRGGLRILNLLKYGPAYDTVNIHFEPSEYFLFGRNPIRALNIFTLLAFWHLFRRLKNLNVVVHEPPPVRHFIQRTPLHRFVWSKVPKITFFTNTERAAFEGGYGIRYSPGQCVVEDVGKSNLKYCAASKREVRQRMQIHPRKFVFLCVGFIHRNKGFDRIARVFRAGAFHNSELYIVGSVRLDYDVDSQKHLGELARECAKSGNIHLINKYLTNEELDEWIVAADYIVVPYRLISNSGILGRAKTYGKRAIVSDVGGLPEQIGLNDFVFSNELELQRIVAGLDSDVQLA